jgi:hypothetical protein
MATELPENRKRSGKVSNERNKQTNYTVNSFNSPSFPPLNCIQFMFGISHNPSNL